MAEKETRKKRSGCLTVFLVLLLIGLLVAATGWWKWKGRPDYYENYRSYLEKTPEDERLDQATQLSNEITSTLSYSGRQGIDELPGGSGPDHNGANIFDGGSQPDPRIRKLTITADQANGWLEQLRAGLLPSETRVEPGVWLVARVTDWLLERGIEFPESIGQLAIGLKDDRILIGFQLETKDISQWITIAFILKIRSNGAKAQLIVDGAMAGSIPVPISWILSFVDLDDLVGEETAKRIRSAVSDGIQFEPVMTHPESHWIRLLNYEIKDNEIILTLRVEEDDEPQEP